MPYFLLRTAEPGTPCSERYLRVAYGMSHTLAGGGA